MRKVITHITPHFSPQIDGLGDYARLLALELHHNHGFMNQIVVGDPAWEADKHSELMPTSRVVSQTSSGLCDKLEESTTVLLHYVGYGYQKRGIPLWITRALKAWKRECSTRKLVTVFHEIWSQGPPWKSEFYLAVIQRSLCKTLLRLSDAAITSVGNVLQALNVIDPGKTIQLPIPSNIPGVALNERRLNSGEPVRIIVFGQTPMRRLAIERHGSLIRHLQNEGLLSKFILVGRDAGSAKELSSLVEILPNHLIEIFSNVSALEASSLFASADLFLSAYPSLFMLKSGALMASMGCGAVPVLVEAKDSFPLQAGREFLACDGSPRALAAITQAVRNGVLLKIAKNGWHWNASHASWEHVGAEVAKLLRR